jgi:flagellar hook assembly protein FlgD
VWRFRFETAGPALDLTAAILDVRGRVVWSEPAGRLAPGAHVFEWDPSADASRPVPSRGVYFLRLTHPGGSSAVRFVLIPR